MDDEETKQLSDALYEEMKKERIEVLYDDRDIRPGVMFADADLFGVPVRVVVSPRNLKEGVVEIVTRDKKISVKAPKDEVIKTVKDIIAQLYAEHTV